MTGIIETKYEVHSHEQMSKWWDAVRESARAAITMTKGSCIYVLETLDDLALTPADRAFIRVHVVSAASGSMYEVDRIVNAPGLLRLLPREHIANIAPIFDGEEKL